MLLLVEFGVEAAQWWAECGDEEYGEFAPGGCRDFEQEDRGGVEQAAVLW